MISKSRFLLCLAVTGPIACGDDASISDLSAEPSSVYVPAAPEESDASEAAPLFESTHGIKVDTRYRYEPAKPQIINGRPVLRHRYWSCVDSLTVEFPKSMRLATVLGKVHVTNTYNSRRAPILTSLDANYRRFSFDFGKDGLCNDHLQLNRLIISQDVRSLDGQVLGRDMEVRLDYPAGRDSRPDENTEAAPPMPSLESVSWVNSPAAGPCAGGTRCITVTAARLNTALKAMRDWMHQERQRPQYRDESLKLLPLDYLLTPFRDVNRRRHYGTPDLLYVLRRAARFTQLLFPDLKAIPIADLSLPDGSTPRVDDILLHPPGSHEHGRDVDVAYITTGSGNDPGAPWHFERNFWFTYAVLQSTGVDLVMTAYKNELTSLAREAYQRGLINSLSVGRFNMLMQDDSLNHDKHMHVSVRNSANGSRSRRFLPSDDVYACYLGLRPNLNGGSHNFCGTI